MHALLLASLLNTAAVDRAVRLVMRTQHVAGISIGIARDGRTLYERGFGMRDLGRRLPADAHTVYRIGSLTKPFTAQAIVRLADAGRISLQQRVAAYLPLAGLDDVTVEQLLLHRSGIPSYSDSDALDLHKAYTPAQLMHAVADEPPHFPAGAQFEYSNTNYVLLGMLIERVSGMPYAAYLQKALLAPEALRATRYGDQPGEARGYARDTLNMPVERSSVSYAYAAAALTSNVPDLLTWLQTVREPYYGFLSEDMYGYNVRYATGNVPGYSAFEAIVPQTGEKIVILTNADLLDVKPLARSIFALLEPPAALYRIRGLVEQLQAGTLDRSVLTPRYRAELSTSRMLAWRTRLAPLGAVLDVSPLGRQAAGNCTNEGYRVTFSTGARIDLDVCTTAGGAIDAIRVTNS